MTRNRVILVCALVGLGSFVALAAIYLGFNDASQANTAREKIALEMAKLLGQLVLIGIVGVIVKAVIDEYSAERESREARTDMRNGVRRDLREVYAKVEMASDLIEAAKTVEMYERQICNIMELHSRLAEIRHEATIPKGLFAEQEKLKERLECMEAYLRRLIDEYREKYSDLKMLEEKRQGGNVSVNMNAQLNELPVLKDFREAHEEGDFNKSFREPYFDARRAIILEVLKDVTDVKPAGNVNRERVPRSEGSTAPLRK